MNQFETRLNSLLVKVYRSLEKLEEEMLRASKNLHLSISEMHMLEAVALTVGQQGASISDLSQELDIRLPSVTLGVNKLVQKGYVSKQRCAGDGRVVRVSLTKEGRRAERAHRYFHQKMVRAVAAELTEDERGTLLKGVAKLDDFLERNLEKYREGSRA